MSNKKIFIRASRRWMKNLALEMKWDSIKDKEKQMHQLTGINILEKIFFHLKKTRLPPIEWFIPYKYLVKADIKNKIIIEPGSRLIKTKENYICYCENGLGILSYNMKKNNKLNIYIAKKMINKDNFLGFVFYSHASRKAAYNIFGDYIKNKDLGIIYPYCKIPLHQVKEKKINSIIKLGFCSNLFILKGGRELVDAVIILNENGYNIELDLLTRTIDIPTDYLFKIKNSKYISITEFNLNNDDYFNHIENWDILIHPSYFDSCPLSIIEIKNLNKPVIATNIFAISEIVNEKDILLDDPKNIFNSNHLPDKDIFLDESIIKLSTIDEKYSDNLFEDIKNKISEFYMYQELKPSPPKLEITPEEIIKKWKNLTSNII